MQFANSASQEDQATVETAPKTEEEHSDQWISERFESLLPRIQEKWPDLAKQTLEATRGSLDELVQVISNHSGKNSYRVQEQFQVILRYLLLCQSQVMVYYGQVFQCEA